MTCEVKGEGQRDRQAASQGYQYPQQMRDIDTMLDRRWPMLIKVEPSKIQDMYPISGQRWSTVCDAGPLYADGSITRTRFSMIYHRLAVLTQSVM